MGTAILVTSGYISSSNIGLQIFYCPSWRHPFFRYNVSKPINSQVYGGWTDEVSKSLPTDHIGISYIYRSSFQRKYRDAGGTIKLSYDAQPRLGMAYNYYETTAPGEKPKYTRTGSSLAFLTDHWYTWGYDNTKYGGKDYNHKVGYNVAYLDGHVSWKTGDVTATQQNWEAQEKQWVDFFDR